MQKRKLPEHKKAGIKPAFKNAYYLFFYLSGQFKTLLRQPEPVWQKMKSVSEQPVNPYRPVSRFQELKRRSASLLTGGFLRLSRMTTGAKIERSEAETMIGLSETDSFTSLTGLPKMKATVLGSALTGISDIFLMISI